MGHILLFHWGFFFANLAFFFLPSRTFFFSLARSWSLTLLLVSINHETETKEMRAIAKSEWVFLERRGPYAHSFWYWAFCDRMRVNKEVETCGPVTTCAPRRPWCATRDCPWTKSFVPPVPVGSANSHGLISALPKTFRNHKAPSHRK